MISEQEVIKVIDGLQSPDIDATGVPIDHYSYLKALEDAREALMERFQRPESVGVSAKAAELAQEAKRAHGPNAKIWAIKELRYWADSEGPGYLGLREAKDTIDSVW